MLKRISKLLCFVALASVGSVAGAEESIAFCLPQLKEMHFDDSAKASLGAFAADAHDPRTLHRRSKTSSVI
jgi:hypothetical protein